LKKVEFCAAVHLAFDEFEFGDLSLDLNIGPRLATPVAKDETRLLLASAIHGSS